MNYYVIGIPFRDIRDLDQWLRRRMRLTYWKQWGRVDRRPRSYPTGCRFSPVSLAPLGSHATAQTSALGNRKRRGPQSKSRKKRPPAVAEAMADRLADESNELGPLGHEQ
jgi:hypothetical protein